MPKKEKIIFGFNFVYGVVNLSKKKKNHQISFISYLHVFIGGHCAIKGVKPLMVWLQYKKLYSSSNEDIAHERVKNVYLRVH